MAKVNRDHAHAADPLPDVLDGDRSSSAPDGQLDVLRRVTRSIVASPELQPVLDSVVTALVEHAGAALARVMLYLPDADCEICSRSGGHLGAEPSLEARNLHVCASSGFTTEVDGPDHVFAAHLPSIPGRALRERQPILTNDLLREMGDGVTEAHREVFVRLGIRAAGAIPLIFRGEPLGVLGVLSREPIEPWGWQIQSIFAEQVAVALKNTQLFAELTRYEARLREENAYLQEEIRTERGFENVVGTSATLRAVLRQVRQVASVDTTVLLTGETGTGKELVARAIHEGSPRKARPLIRLNCGAIPQGVVESELFGHERGAFTGAHQRRLGRFELADRGTLFLDEVGELSPDVQIKLLRVLQEGELERVGGDRSINVDVRLVAATNRDLEDEVAAGRFRSDLLFRLNVFPIHLPPLRERLDDIPQLVSHFIQRFARRLGRRLLGPTPGSVAELQLYQWPGNIRELQNVVERACVLANGPLVDVAAALRMSTGEETEAEAPILPLEESERQLVRRALEVTNGRIHGPDGAAALLGLNGSTLRSRMQKLGIEKHVS